MMEGVLRMEDGRLATINLVPGKKVYDEFLIRIGDKEARTWDPTRSKLAAYVLKGGNQWPFTSSSRVLYLGAANGTTPSHVSDAVPQGLVVGVEFSPRSFRDLVAVASDRPNLIPVLADAWKPESYARFIGQPDILYMDIAQREQARVMAKNIIAFRPKAAYFMVKARSIDVARDPREVIGEAAQQVAAETGYAIMDVVDLAPFEKDHACVVLIPGGSRQEGAFDRPRGMVPDRRFRREDRGPPMDRGRPPRRDDRGPPRRDDRGGPRGGPPRGGFGGGKGGGKGFRKGPR